MSEQMAGGDGAHVPAHRRTPYCQYMNCSPIAPNFVDCVEPRGCGCPEAARCDTCDPPALACATDPDARTPAYEPPPKHYQGDGIEPWRVVDAWGLDFYVGNVLKYICRAGKKDIATRLDDLNKARNYINKAIELEEGK